MALENLEEEVELLRQQLAGLTGSSKEIGVLRGLGRGMSDQMATMLFVLVKRSPASVSRQAFHTLFYGDRIDGGPELSVFAVQVHRLRELLKRRNIPGSIDTLWGVGYKASPDLVRWIKELYNKEV